MTKIIFDIEASCDDRNINPHYNMETIEIGAVKVLNGEIIDEFQTFIKPEYITELTPFCIELTGITFEDLEDAPSFNEAILDFFTFIYGATIYSCGEFDRKFLVRELKEKGDSYVYEMVSNAIQASHVNLKKHYSQITSKPRQGMVGMAEELGIELTGAHHRALDDTRNLTKIFFKLEKMREDELRKVVTNKRIEEILYDINKNHDDINITLSEDLLYNVETDNKKDLELSYVELLDYLKYLIKVDHGERNVKYLTPRELKTLIKFTV